MRRFRTITLLNVLFIGAYLSSCKKEKKEDPQPPAPQEFVADNNTFANFNTWNLQATLTGPNPSLGGMAHGGNDSTVTRKIYFKDGASRVNGKYPVGTVIVKHATNTAGTMNEVTAMVKRGNNFSPDGGDWEWFMLMPNGNIMTDSTGNPMRGANLMGGMCKSCHNGASANDYTFSK